MKTKQRPYLLRAMHEWMVDNGLTPHIVVDASRSGVQVPEGHVKDGKIVLNISPGATHSLVLGNDRVTFEARFAGVPRGIVVPTDAVLGVYARETGQGMIFGEDDAPPPSSPTTTPSDGGGAGSSESRKPKLTVIK